MSSYTTGQLARLSGVGVETIRYYERKGLIPEPPRRESGYSGGSIIGQYNRKVGITISV